tara:strand:+ start:553 stop:1473 length:921 start_codon:yes stop_codon:yes gene_type:complete
MKKILFKSIIFILGFASSIYVTDYTNFTNNIKRRITETVIRVRGFSVVGTCQIKQIANVPKDSVVVIGHAYGSQSKSLSRNHIGMAPSVKFFIDQNLNNIGTLIFTGDVFSIPSRVKWENLYESYEDYFEIFISPGDHDVGSKREGGYIDTSQRDIFNSFISGKQPINKAFLITRQGFKIVIEDATLDYNNKHKDYFNESFLQIKKLLDKNQDNLSKKIIILRHHQSIDMKNPYKSKNKIISFSKIFEKYTKSFIVYGNTHGTRCLDYNKSMHIESGIGETEDDSIIILHKNEIYLYKIDEIPSAN